MSKHKFIKKSAIETQCEICLLRVQLDVLAPVNSDVLRWSRDGIKWYVCSKIDLLPKCEFVNKF